MSGPSKWFAVGTVSVAFGLAILLVALPWPPSAPSSPTSAALEVIDGKTYAYESEALYGSGAWPNFSYGGVTFGFHLWCSAGPAVGVICGNATELSGLRYNYSFTDGPPVNNPKWETWVSPDLREAVQYMQGGRVRLLIIQPSLLSYLNLLAEGSLGPRLAS